MLWHTPAVRSGLQQLPVWLVIVALAALFLVVAGLGWWRARRAGGTDSRDLGHIDAIASVALSVSISGFTLLGSFAAYSLWGAESSRSALLSMELAAARSMVVEAQTPGTAQADPIIKALTAYTASLVTLYQTGDIVSADQHNGDPMLDLTRALRPLLPTHAENQSQDALEADYRAVVSAHNQRTTMTRPLLPGIVFWSLLAMGVAAAYVAGRFPIGRGREWKTTQVIATAVILTALMTIVVVLDSPATSAARSLPELQTFLAWLQAGGH